MDDDMNLICMFTLQHPTNTEHAGQESAKVAMGQSLGFALQSLLLGTA